MIAAPGSSILPSPFASRRLPFQLCSSFSICCARGVVGVPSRDRSGTSVWRRSFVAAAFIAETTLAGVCFFVPTFVFSRSTRCTEPYDQLSSAAPNAAAGLLFQLTICPLFGSTTCGCDIGPSQPRHSYEPLPFVGRPPFTPGLRSGSRPLEYIAMCFESA